MPDYDICCDYCGKQFTAHDARKRFCSKKCKDISYRIKMGVKCNPSTEPHKKICSVCGNAFDSYRDNAVTCSTECAKRHKALHDRERNRKAYPRSWDEYVNERKTEAEQNKIKKEFYRIQYKKQHTVQRECVECGEIFYCLDSQSNITCSSECSKHRQYRKADKRIPKEQRVDKISLRRLYKRDNGVCYLCGCVCDWDDWKISDRGHKYPGDRYPTIEHIIPVSKGGLDAWDNVRLACSTCNNKKADEVLDIKPLGKEFAYSAKYCATQAKKTAQYSLDGVLIKIWESTGQIKRELGLNEKRIQNVCRGDRSKTGNAFGYHWEYVS